MQYTFYIKKLYNIYLMNKINTIFNLMNKFNTVFNDQNQCNI